MLFKPEHQGMILSGRKTQTRRIWKMSRVKVNGVYKAKTKMLSKEYFAKIRVIKLFKQKLDDISDEDIHKEGYNNKGEFKNIWVKINGEWKNDLIVDVIEFKLVEKSEGSNETK